MRQAITAWHQVHPHRDQLLGASPLGFTKDLAREREAEPIAPESVFGLFGLDPLAGLDPATREIALTRMFAERALFVSQWILTLLRWQIELLGLNAMAMPPVQQLLSNSTQLAASVERFSHLAGQWPEQVGHERAKIIQALEDQEKGLATLAGEVRQSFDAGSQLSKTLNTTLETFTALMQRFGVGETNTTRAASTNAQPFRILDYAQTATQLESMARQLTTLLRTVDETTGSNNLSRISTQLTPVVQQAQSSGKEIVDYAFRKGLLLVAAVLVAALGYRWLGARLAPAAPGRINPP